MSQSSPGERPETANHSAVFQQLSLPTAGPRIAMSAGMIASRLTPHFVMCMSCALAIGCRDAPDASSFGEGNATAPTTAPPGAAAPAIAQEPVPAQRSEPDIALLHDLARVATTDSDRGARRAALVAIADARLVSHGAAATKLADGTLADMERAVLEIDDVPILIAALEAEDVFTYEGSALAALIARTSQLVEHEHPGVRGEALTRLGTLYEAQQLVTGKYATEMLDARIALVDGALADQHAFVRGRAASLLTRVYGNPSTLAKLVALADDPAKVTYSYEYEQAGGGTVRYLGESTPNTVGEEARGALFAIAAIWGESEVAAARAVGFTDWTGLDHGDVAAIRAWYAGKKAAIAAAYPAMLADVLARSR